MAIFERSRGLRLSVRNLTRYFGARAVLSGVNLEAAPGEFVAVVGKSGCGKTTLLRTLAGLDQPSEGVVALDDHDHAANAGPVRMIFQDARLLPWKRLIDNVGLGLPRQQRRGERIVKALARVGLSGRDLDWPGVLSGGERQRVALARALVSRPGLLLLDEPLGALDALTRLEMQELIERLWAETGFTAVLVTHDVHEAVALADRVVSLEAGRVSLNIEVRLPRPRPRHTAAFNAVVADILGHLLGHRAVAPSAQLASALSTRPQAARIAG
jgi:sulfonate transport system ATP-binding protein